MAFDSLAWDFILTFLENSNFNSDTIKWVKSLQNNATSYVLQDGHLSEPILLGRGCRQWDLVSPYLFVLAVAESIRQNSKIEGLKIHGKEHQVSKYADDTTLYIKQRYEYLAKCLDTLDEFEQILDYV